jgi:glucokinase
MAKKTVKKARKKTLKKALAFDLGGTKLAAAVIDESGQILDIVRAKVDLSGGPSSLINQFYALGAPFIKTHKLKMAVIASAGPLNPVTGVLLNPTNLKTNGQRWGDVPLTQLVEKKLKIKTKLENDAAAATLAEYWIGVGKGSDNILSITLGTGLGVGIITNGKLVRSGRNLHTEGGHIILDYQDKDWLCGCGNYGCAEAFLSGVNFTKHLAEIYKDPALDGHKLVELARKGDQKTLNEFKSYGLRLAAFLYSHIVLFSPEKIIISGGFSHSADLFLPVTTKKLEVLLATRRTGIDMMPQILISKFRDEAGLLGAAYVAFSEH